MVSIPDPDAERISQGNALTSGGANEPLFQPSGQEIDAVRALSEQAHILARTVAICLLADC
jgi:hypothetical protein